ncbi:peptidase S8/S53 domain-containing protein [Lineolata rhizophorae]|uniref:Peptidase S8/S53 domain-containing protein n=1 Tax=Lineolata rhizophorae TaxID=578093 RepID=A0A6A6NXI1_9PEZI|nr:peptidase S8/S53 domain-containing protein [Lineolata rhizophorae]
MPSPRISLNPESPVNTRISPSQLVVIFNSQAQVQTTVNGLSSDTADLSNVQSILDENDASIESLFGLSPDRLRSQQARLSFPESVPDLSSFYRVKAPEDKFEQIASALRAVPEVKAAYVRPGASAPLIFKPTPPAFADAPAATPDFTSRQGYLNPAPEGVDAKWAQTQPGGRGDGIRIVDCEWAWRFSHEDLRVNQGGVIFGQQGDDDNHGTAVQGVVGGDQNSYGVIGIAPNSTFFGSSFENQDVATTIKAAADILNSGDVILLEIQISGPNAGNWIAVEWYPDILAVIRYAVMKGIVVAEAAGNGGENFDDPIYDQPQPGFPSDWRNPYNPSNPSSGAVMVGAGAPPPGTHGRNYGPDRSRLSFSNYGARLDAQGWGVEVTTTGYGDLQSDSNPDLWYTDQFNGTSSASPVVTGALLCLNGILRSWRGVTVTSEQARMLVRQTGSPQQDGPNGPASQRIGNRPNMRQLVPAAQALFP